MFFISPAFAQEATETAVSVASETATAQEPSTLVTFAPLIIIFIIFYFLVMRPQSKRIREHQETIKSLKKGDKVVTGGGIIGTITKLTNEKEIELEIAKDTKINVQRNTLLGVYDNKDSKAS